jgi:DNA mismatch repair protein MSH3
MKRKTVSGLLGTDKQPQISSFFAQQPPAQEKYPHSKNTTIDLTLEDPEVDEQPPIKKLKVEKGNSLADQWRFDSTRKPSIDRPIARNEDDKKRRHDGFKRILLAGNGSFARQKHVEDKRAQSSEEESLQGQADAHESDDSDEAFKNLREIFSHKSKKVGRKPRLTSSAKGKEASEGLGPSGQPYTPAELQASLADCPHVAFNHILAQS